MAEAAGGQMQNQTGGPADQGYNSYAAQGNSYAAQGSVYPSPPSNAGLAAQTGAYGSVYGTNYGY